MYLLLKDLYYCFIDSWTNSARFLPNMLSIPSLWSRSSDRCTTFCVRAPSTTFCCVKICVTGVKACRYVSTPLQSSSVQSKTMNGRVHYSYLVLKGLKLDIKLFPWKCIQQFVKIKIFYTKIDTFYVENFFEFCSGSGVSTIGNNALYNIS